MAAEAAELFRSDDQAIPSTIKQAIERQCSINSDRPAIVSTVFGLLTYADLERVVCEIPKGLARGGIWPVRTDSCRSAERPLCGIGDTFGFLLGNCHSS